MSSLASQRLVGWKVICAYLRCSERQARRWASKHRSSELRLPIGRYPLAHDPRRKGNGHGRVVAYVDDLDAWEARVLRGTRSATSGK